MQRLMVTETATSEAKIIGPSADVQYLGLAFSRDNSYLYFTRKESNGPGILYRMSLPLGGVAKVKEGVDSPISFSPRQDRFAFVRQSMTTNDYSLMVSDVSGSSEQTVATRRNGDVLSVYGVAWSPDGSTIICPTGHWDNGYHVSLIAFDVKTGRERVVGAPSWFSVLQVAWRSDMTGLIVSGKEHPTTAHQLWRVSYPDGEKQRITPDLAEYRSVSLSGDNIITVRTSRSWRLWVVPMDDFRKARDITSGVGLCYGLAWPSTRNIVFSAMDHEHLNLFRIDPDGSRRNALTSEGDNYSPATCQDGRAIVYSSNRTGSFNIWRMNAEDGLDAKQLTFSDANYYPACSPDNQWIAFDRQQFSAKLNIWKMPMEGGEPIKVADNYRMPVFSPDSQYIAGRYDPDSGTRDAAIFSSQGGPPQTNFPIPIQEWQRPQWLADGSISYIKTIDGASNIWSVDPRTGKSKQLTYFISDQIFSYAWSPDYKQLACQRGTKISDVTMISSER
jgi:Tol biopolymer transport system component